MPEPELREAFEAGFKAAQDKCDEAWSEWLSGQRELYPLSELDLPVRAYNRMHHDRIRTVGEARMWLTPGAHPDYPPRYVAALDIRGMGAGSVKAAQEALRRFDEEAQ